MKFKSCNLHFSWNVDLNFNIRHVEFSLYSFNLFKLVTSSSNDAISTVLIAISNSYDEISTWIVSKSSGEVKFDGSSCMLKPVYFAFVKTMLQFFCKLHILLNHEHVRQDQREK